MKHKHHHHHAFYHLKKKYKRLAATVAAAAIMAGTMVPGIPAAIAHASPNPTADNPVTVSQQIDHNSAATNTKQELSVTATAYAPGAHDNDQWGNKTFMGTPIQPGVVAVDPSVIPLGSKLLLTYPDGHTEHAVAQDTGGAIKGNRIDVAKSNVKAAQDFGIQHVKITVLSSPKEG